MKRVLHKIKLSATKLYQWLGFSSETDIALLTLIISLYVFRMAIPFLKWLLIPVLAFVILYALIKVIATGHNTLVTLLPNLRWFVPFGLVILFFIIGFLRSSIISPFIITEMLNIAVIFIILLLLLLFVKDINDYEVFKKKMASSFLIFATVISIFGLIKFFYLMKGITFDVLMVGNKYPWGSSLMQDYNFFSLGVLLGVGVIVFYYFRRRNPLLHVIFYHAAFLIMFYNVAWSGSRRGFLALIFFIIAMLLFRVVMFFKKERVKHANLIHNINILLLTAGFSIVLATYFFKYYPHEKKDRIIASLKLDEETTKLEVTKITYRHLHSLNLGKGINVWYEELWGYNYFQSAEERFIQKDKKAFSNEVEDLLQNEKSKIHHSRIDRWYFAITLYMKNYNPTEKIFGKGFDYLYEFKENYSETENLEEISDYPHNSILSAFLYSGLLGGIVYLLFLVQVIVVYLNHRKVLLMLLPLFLFVLFFALVSGNSIFSIPVFAVFSILPIHYAYINKHAAIE